MAIGGGPLPRAGAYYDQRWAQLFIQRLEEVISYLSGQIEVDVPLVGLSGRRHKTVSVTSSSYTATNDDHEIFCYVGTTVTLPTGAGTGQMMRIWDASGIASLSPITVQPESGLISHKPKIVINENGGQVMCIYTGSMWLASGFVEPLIAAPQGDLVLSTSAPTVS